MHDTSRTVALIALLALASGACGDSPASPSPPPPNTAFATGLSISGPPTIAPGATAQYAATLQMADGTTADVTSLATWSSQSRDTSVLFQARGAAFGRSRGQAAIFAAYGQMQSQQLLVMVLEDGTFRLFGEITETGTSRQIRAAVIIAEDDGGRSLHTSSDSDGLYELYGLSGQVRITISAPSYATRTEDIVVTGHAFRDFTLSR